MSNAKYSDIEAVRSQIRECFDRLRRLENKIAEIERHISK